MGRGRRRCCADTCQRSRALLGNVVLGLGEGGGGGARGGLFVRVPVNHERGAGLEKLHHACWPMCDPGRGWTRHRGLPECSERQAQTLVGFFLCVTVG